MKEIWKPVVGYEGFYEVSNTGEVRSLDRICRGRSGRHVRRGRVLKQQTVRGRGYQTVTLAARKKHKNHKVHRLVAFAFIKNEDCSKIFVNHKDGCKSNNRVENLEWCTRAENNAHAIATGLNDQVGEKHAQAKLNNIKIRVIRRMCDTGYWDMKEIGEMFGITGTHVSYINKRKVWGHIQ